MSLWKRIESMTHSPLPLTLFLIVLTGCGQADQERLKAVEKNTQTTKEQENTASLALFEKRILPIFQSPKPSSCSECHLSGVDLKEYIRPTQQGDVRVAWLGPG
jgi:hypothetical protein